MTAFIKPSFILVIYEEILSGYMASVTAKVLYAALKVTIAVCQKLCVFASDSRVLLVEHPAQ